MKNASETERIALKQILKLKKDGGSREDALALAKLSAGHPVTIPKGDQGEGERENGGSRSPGRPVPCRPSPEKSAHRVGDVAQHDRHFVADRPHGDDGGNRDQRG